MKRPARIPSPALSDFSASLLQEEAIAPEVLSAVGLSELGEGTFEIPYGLRGKAPTLRRWEIDIEPEPWPESQEPGVWWPAGRDGLTVIVCLGARDGLFLLSQLFRVGHDGGLYRRADLPSVLENAVLVVLPRTVPDLAFEWYRAPRQGIKELLEEIVIEPRESVFLAVPRPRADMQPITQESEPAFERFVDEFLGAGESYGVVPGLALLPWGTRWSELLAGYRGAAKRAALGGIFDYWNAMSVCAPSSEGGPP